MSQRSDGNICMGNWLVICVSSIKEMKKRMEFEIDFLVCVFDIAVINFSAFIGGNRILFSSSCSIWRIGNK
jgi:hypothetical protein